MNIKKEQEEQIVNFGVFGYDAKKIASILGEEYSIVVEAMADNKSKLSKLLQKGRDMSDYVIDLKLFEMAQKGDLKALNKLEHRRGKNI